MLDNLKCTGRESKLMYCPSSGWKKHDCTHSEDVGVLCSNPRTGVVRLSNSKRLEIYYNGEWGTVCDDSFDEKEAMVVCRQLGYSNGTSLGALVKDGTGSILLDDLNCTGRESKLMYCPSSGWKKHDCTHSEDVGVLCNNRVNGGWSTWKQWSTCSRTCGIGLQTRTRQCNNPSTQYGGEYCNGLPSQTIACNIISCPVIDGGWSSWTNWTDCSKPCNGGLNGRSRNCDSPPPFNGGLYCNGNITDVKLCNTFSCSGIETSIAFAAIVTGVAVGSILISVMFVLICQHVFARMKTSKKGTKFTYIKNQINHHNLSIMLLIRNTKIQKNAAKTEVDSDPDDIYDKCEENCYENFRN
ncbi:PRSS12 [Mytilus coruscus]|uniref:PRSS12 n=1 Tax=Mytilus coruscus TaxID=42192 RepID=A0A6J8ANA7_MYTCO|nr:PRSS12 [Mytilus coruscus]